MIAPEIAANKETNKEARVQQKKDRNVHLKRKPTNKLSTKT